MFGLNHIRDAVAGALTKKKVLPDAPNASIDVPSLAKPGLDPMGRIPDARPNYRDIPRQMVGGAKLGSEGEREFLEERNMIRPNNFSFKERMVEALKSGAVQGMQAMAASGGDWRAGLGGFVGGAGGGVFDPRVGARARYSTVHEPEEIMRERIDWAREKQGLERNKARLDEYSTRQKIGLDAADEGRRQAEEERKRELHASALRKAGLDNVSPGQTIFNTATGKAVYTAPERPTYHRVGDALVTSEGKEIYVNPRPSPASREDISSTRLALQGSPEEIAMDSMRGREESIRAKLPPAYQQALSNPNGVDAETAMDARRAYEQLWDQEYRRVLAETEGRGKSADARKRVAPSAGGPSRSVGDLTSKFPELRKRLGGK